VVETPLLWLRVATLLYGVGFLDTILVVLHRGSERFSRLARAAFSTGLILHSVSFVELAIYKGRLPLDNFLESISTFALLTALLFWLVYWKLQFEGLTVMVYPLVFVMALVGSLAGPAGYWTNSTVRDAWLIAHILLVLLGYAALGLSAVASAFYLAQERRLKRKQELGWLGKLPPLGTLDRVITQSMGVAFLLITLAVIVGSIWAFLESGTRWVRDPKIAVSLVTWAFYLIMVFLRTSAGWRGRRAALLVLAVVCCSAVTWAAHVGLRPLLVR